MPPDVRAEVGRFRFDKQRFAETIHIQPCETRDVVCWEPAFLSADGKRVRQIGNNFADAQQTYEEFYREMTERERDWLKGITFDPPRKR